MRPLIGTALVLGALGVAAAPAVAAPEDFTSGSATFACGSPPNACGGSASFTGHGTPADAHGTVKIDLPADALHSRGSVDCVSVDGNRATLTGVLDKPSPGLEGPFYSLQVEDNGSPGRVADRMSFGTFFLPIDCAFVNQFRALFPVVRGNVVVKDNTP